MAASADLDPRTPVIVGVGQAVERIDDPDYEGLSPVELAARAAQAALADSGGQAHRLVAEIDTIATTRQLANSTPGAPAPLGNSTKFPLSLACRLGAEPRRAVLEVAGGQSPQHLVNEFTREICEGRSDVVLLAGAEAISTVRHFADAERKPDFADNPDDPQGVFEDRGYGLKGLVTLEQASHGLVNAPVQYALLENARRRLKGMSRDDYRMAMAQLFAPFTKVAAANPYSATTEELDVADLVAVTDRNRPIADPYTRLIVARDQVNQAAAVLLASIATARRLGIEESRWVFLHGQADLREPDLFDRNELGEAPSAVAAVRHALEVAGRDLHEVNHFDFYSCFPIAVSNITDALGLRFDDPRGFTLTGGLPYFGGAGNNYSMHAIAEAVDRVRTTPGTFALVTANGGILSKTSVGIYSATPCTLKADRSAELQRTIDESQGPVHVAHPNGRATIEAYTVQHVGGKETGVLVGRLNADDRRFVAQVAPGDDELLTLLKQAPQPIGQQVYVTAHGYGNRATISDARAAQLFPKRTPVFREGYECVQVRRDGRLLEVTINRPEVRNSLHPPAHEELDEIFDAYFADPELWVAILTGAGDRSFCAGNDLRYTTSGKPMYAPLNGFAGLTSRKGMHKPVIAAVNGSAMGGGFEIALACHLVVADETAGFALSEVKVGLIAGAGGLIRLSRAVPPRIANELILTGRPVGADEARRLGLVNRVAPAGKVMTAARELAAEILAGSPTSVRLSLTLMEETEGIADTNAAVTHPTQVIDELMVSADAHEGMTAFVVKRPPQWKNC